MDSNMLQQRDNGIINNGGSVPQTRKEYSVAAPVGIPIPGRSAGRPVSAYHPSSSGFFSSSSEDESDGSLTNSSSPPLSDTHMLSSSYHGAGYMTTGNMGGTPLNVYGTSPRTSVMFNYYSSPKGSYGRHHPQLMSSGKLLLVNKHLAAATSCDNISYRAKSGESPSVHHHTHNGRADVSPLYKSTENLHLSSDKKSKECYVQICKAKGVGSKMTQHLQQRVDNRPRAWSESDKNQSNSSMQSSRVSALRKLKMKLAQKGPLKRQKSVDEEDKGKAGNVPSLEKLEEGRQLNCASVAARLQNMSLETSSFLHQEHEVTRKPERRIGVTRFSSPPHVLPQVQENPDDRLVYQRFLEEHTCYDIMPTSSKLVVLDTRLEVKKAFHALIENSLRSAPLWDNELQDYVGLLTVSDFVSILLAYHKCPNKKLEDVENQKISCWRKVLDAKKTLIRVAPEASLLGAIDILTKEKIRRLAIVDPDNGDVFHVINYRRILHFLHLFINELPKPGYMSKSVGELGLATPKEVATVSEDSPVIKALELIDKHKVSGLPVLDSNGRVTDIFTKTDVLVLAGEQLFYDLSIQVSTVISLHSVEQTEDAGPQVTRMMPGSPALVRRRNQPRHDQRDATVKPHPFLRDADNAPRLMPSPLVPSSHNAHRQSDSKRTRDRSHHHGAVRHLSGGHAKGDGPVLSPPNAQGFLHRRRHLSNHLSKSTSISSHLVTVTKHDTLEAVMNNIVTSDVLQAVVVDDFDNVQGVISIGDILRFMVYPTDENGKPIVESAYEKPPLVRSRSARSHGESRRDSNRTRTASDDSDLTSSLVRKNSRTLSGSSTVDSAYSDASTASLLKNDSGGSSDKLLEVAGPGFAWNLESGEMMERL